MRPLIYLTCILTVVLTISLNGTIATAHLSIQPLLPSNDFRQTGLSMFFADPPDPDSEATFTTPVDKDGSADDMNRSGTLIVTETRSHFIECGLQLYEVISFADRFSPASLNWRTLSFLPDGYPDQFVTSVTTIAFSISDNQSHSFIDTTWGTSSVVVYGDKQNSKTQEIIQLSHSSDNQNN